MIEVINLLVFVDYDIRRQASEKTREFMPGRPIFRSIGANGVRVKLMRNLLGQFIGHLKRRSLRRSFSRISVSRESEERLYPWNVVDF